MKKPFLIGVTGGSGSGKTSFIKEIAQHFSKDELAVISQDNYYKPKEQQQIDDTGIVNFDLPTAIYEEELFDDLVRIQKGETLKRKEYTFNNELKEAKDIVVAPAPIIIVEGLFIFHFSKIAQLFDLKVVIESDNATQVIRRIKRDQIERNYPLEDVLYRYENHALKAYNAYIAPYISQADVVINNYKEMAKGIDVFLGFLKSKL